ncbi:MAG: TIGR02206 family membrane protein [Saprospiraceae bacterium]|nr:TIGR02206 family membrane protein [Saprospiraceae bacterium]
MATLLLFSDPVFVSYGTEHLLWLLAGAASMVVWIGYGARQKTELGRRRVGLAMSLIPALIWLSSSAWLMFNMEPLDLGLVLPFHICYFLNLLLPVMLWQRNYFLFEVSYFMVMAGCIQALLTPDLQTTFPDHYNVRYFFVHIGLAQSVLYAIIVYRFRPTWRSLGKSLLWSNVYFVFVAVINWVLGTNFMYLRQKPPSPTLLDLFGAWPWYILGGEVLALILFTVVMLPFALRRPSTPITSSDPTP